MWIQHAAAVPSAAWAVRNRRKLALRRYRIVVVSILGAGSHVPSRLRIDEHAVEFGPCVRGPGLRWPHGVTSLCTTTFAIWSFDTRSVR